MNNNTKVWEAMGFLDAIPKDKHEDASEIFNDACSYMEYISRYKFIPGQIETAFIPILTRIMRDKKIYKFDMKEFFLKLPYSTKTYFCLYFFNKEITYSISF